MLETSWKAGVQPRARAAQSQDGRKGRSSDAQEAKYLDQALTATRRSNRPSGKVELLDMIKTVKRHFKVLFLEYRCLLLLSSSDVTDKIQDFRAYKNSVTMVGALINHFGTAGRFFVFHGAHAWQ